MAYGDMALDKEGKILRKPHWYSAAEYRSAIETMRQSAERWRDLAIDRGQRIATLEETADFHRHKAEEWLTAYQNTRVKHVGDYTRSFVRRPRMRRLIQFLMRL